MRRAARILIALLLLPCLSLPAQAAEKKLPKPAAAGQPLSPPTATAADVRKIESQLEKKKQQAAALEETRRKAEAELAALRGKLVSAAADERKKQAEKDRLGSKLAHLQREAEAKQAEWSASEKQASAALAALTRLSRLPPEALLLHASVSPPRGEAGDTMVADPAAAPWHTALLLRAAIPALRARAQAAQEARYKLDRLHTEMAERRTDLAGASRALTRKQQELNDLIAARQKFAVAQGAQYAVLRNDVEKLGKEAANLRQLFDKVSRRLPGGKPGGKEAQRALRGSMVMPVAGEQVAAFGKKDKYGVDSEGISWRAAAGARVVSPRAGRVMFAGPFRGYGRIVIVEHGKGMHSLLAGFGAIDVETGQQVAAGEPLGTAAGGEDAPMYFELRQDGEPVDPFG
ncbi:MAG: peptidoglycan DD-metalloendopeptidase family protein [Alphaproteobacteria bacterium]|nr:peptidoglycan DD-metalloendopeptidase family protein [Alphaproteobacteria bacterium]